MATLALTASSFDETVSLPGITIVDFSAEWCGPCRAFAPTFERAAQLNPEIRFCKVDTEAESELAAQARVSSIPTLLVFRDGLLVFRASGAMPPWELTRVIKKVQHMDMDRVQARVNRRRSKAEAKAAK